MIRFQISFILLLLGIVLTIPCDAAPKSALGPTTNVETEYLKVFNSESLDFEQIVKKDDEIWVLAKVQPSPNNRRVEGILRDSKTGRISALPGSQPVTVFDGSLEIVAVLNGLRQKEKLPYRWEIQSTITPDAKFIGTLVDDTYLILQEENFVVVRLTRDTGIGSALTDSTSSYVVPQEWQQYVLTAVEYYRSNAALFVARDAYRNLDQLESLLDNPNPFIVSLACRTLVQGRALDIALAQKLLTNSRGYLQAVLTTAMLVNAPGPPPWTTSPTLEEQIKRQQDPTLPKSLLNYIRIIDEVVRKSSDSNQIEGIALGVWVAATSPTPDQSINLSRHFARVEKLSDLLLPMQKKLSEWGTKTESDQRLNSYLRAMRVPQTQD